MSRKVNEINILHLRSSGGLFGAEGVILNLAQYLNGTGFNNFIACLNNSENPHTELLREAKKFGIKTIRVNCRGRFDLRAIFEIRNLLISHRVKILHCHDYKANFFGFWASRFLNLKLIATNHLWTKETMALRFYEFIDAILLNLFHRVIAVSDEVAKEVQRLCMFKKKLTIVYNGIDLSKFSPSANGQKLRKELKIPKTHKVVGAVGRLSVQKGFADLLEAAKVVLNEISEVYFLIVGNGPLKEHLQKKVKNLGIEHNVIFVGERKDMVDIYNCMDVFVLPSLLEGLPLAVLEALAMQKPVIATRVGGVPLVIHPNRTGILLKPHKVRDLTVAIMNLLNNRKKTKSLASNGRKFVKENFSAERMAEDYRKIYETVLN